MKWVNLEERGNRVKKERLVQKDHLVLEGLKIVVTVASAVIISNVYFSSTLHKSHQRRIHYLIHL